MLHVVYGKMVFCHHSCLQFMLMISLNVSEGQAMAFTLAVYFVDVYYMPPEAIGYLWELWYRLGHKI